jgi:hypothetical protein
VTTNVLPVNNLKITVKLVELIDTNHHLAHVSSDTTNKLKNQKNVEYVTTNVLIVTNVLPVVSLVPQTESAYQNVSVQLVTSMKVLNLVEHAQLNVENVNPWKSVLSVSKIITYMKVNVETVHLLIGLILLITLVNHVTLLVKLVVDLLMTNVLLVTALISSYNTPVSQNVQTLTMVIKLLDIVFFVPLNALYVSEVKMDNVMLVKKVGS